MGNITNMNKFNFYMKESVNDECKKLIIDIGNYKYYYDNSYSEIISHYFLKRCFVSKELSFKNESKHIPICSISSSARLCFLYFLEKCKDDNFMLEQSFPIMKKNGSILTYAHPDSIVKNVYYECKAQEIVEGEDERLKKSYLDSAQYFDELFEDVSVISINNGYLEFSMHALGVNLNKKYYETKINVKQLICHLLALANKTYESKKEWKLKYLLFRPSKRYDKELVDIYNELDNEIDLLFNTPNKITKFCKEHSIEIKSEYVCIDELDELIVDNISDKKFFK